MLQMLPPSRSPIEEVKLKDAEEISSLEFFYIL